MNATTRLFLVLFVVALIPGSAPLAEVTTHDGDPADLSEKPPVVLETNRITDDDSPIPSLWEPVFDPNNRIHSLNRDGAANGDGRPSIVLHPLTRMPIAAWALNTETGYDIVVSRFVDGAWTVPEVVAGGVDDELDPHLSINKTTGRVHLLYRTGDVTPRIEHRKATLDVLSWGAPSTVSQPGEIAVRPSGVWSGERMLVAYEVHIGALDASSRQIVVAERLGQGWLGEIVTGSEYDGPSVPQIHSAGERIWVDWVDAPGVVRWTCRENDGPWTPLVAEPFDGVEDREYHVRGRVKHAVRRQQ